MDGIRIARFTGFTLIELMVVIGLVSIMQGLVIPTFARLVESSRIYFAAHTLRVDLRSAQAASARLRQFIRVCPSASGLSCDADNNWQQGWITYREAEHFAGEPFFRRILFHQQARKGLRISANGIGNSVRFAPDYRIGSNFSLTICGNSREVPGLAVVVTQVGRIRIEKAAVSC